MIYNSHIPTFYFMKLMKISNVQIVKTKENRKKSVCKGLGVLVFCYKVGKKSPIINNQMWVKYTEYAQVTVVILQNIAQAK